MKKRIVSTILAAVMTISAVSVIKASADLWGETDSSSIDKVFSDHIKIEDKYEWLHKITYSTLNPDHIYLLHNPNTHNYNFVFLNQSSDRIVFNVAENYGYSALENKLSDIDKSLSFKTYDFSVSNNSRTCYINSPEITSETLKAIRETLGNSATYFNFENNPIFYYTSEVGSMTRFLFNDEETIQKVQTYINENNLDVEISSDSHDSCYTVIKPLSELSPIEHIEFINELYLATDCFPDFTIPQSSENSEIVDFTLDLTDYLNGDANCDRKYSIADSTAILQALGNPDKYGLSDLGLFNADSTGDGLTVEDAVAIKTALAKGIE
jgi:hypothetical protein